MSFSLNEHEQGCTPLQPCRTCRIVSFLRERLGTSEFDKFLALCNDSPDARANGDLNIPIAELRDQISSRAYNCLIQNNIKTLGDLVGKTAYELLRVREFGRKSLDQVEMMLTQRGLRLQEPPEETELPNKSE